MIFPKLLSLTLPTGSPYRGWLRALKNSALNCRFTLSLMRWLRLRERLKFCSPGPRRFGCVRESFPNVNGAGFVKALVSNHLSTDCWPAGKTGEYDRKAVAPTPGR